MLESPFLCPQSLGDEEVICLWHPTSSVLLTKMPLSTMFLHMSVVAMGLLSGSSMWTSAAPEPVSQHPMVKETCVTYDHPNPLHDMYPNNATGVLNTTLAIVPIALEDARRVIPSQFNILEDVYRSLLPDFPEGMYPVLVQAGHDHDIRFQNFTIADFSRAGYEFPFVDLLGDGYSSFRWVPEQLIEAENNDAILGSRAYGTTVHPSEHDPGCNAYNANANGGTYFNGTSMGQEGLTYMSLEFERRRAIPYPISFFKNITNQPIFADAANPICDNMIRLFNTSLSTGEFEPIPVEGSVMSNLGPFKGSTHFGGVFGVQLATPFIENNFLDCKLFKGYEDVFN